MSEIQDRVKQVREKLGLSQKEFAVSLNKRSQAWTSAIELGVSPVSEELKEKLERIYKVSRQWLETGEGDMFIGGESPAPVRKDTPQHSNTSVYKISDARPVTITITNTVVISVGALEE